MLSTDKITNAFKAICEEAEKINVKITPLNQERHKERKCFDLSC